MSNVLAVRVYEKDLAPRGAAWLLAILRRGSDDLAKRARLAIVNYYRSIGVCLLVLLATTRGKSRGRGGLGWSWVLSRPFRESDHERELSEDRELSSGVPKPAESQSPTRDWRVKDVEGGEREKKARLREGCIEHHEGGRRDLGKTGRSVLSAGSFLPVVTYESQAETREPDEIMDLELP